MTSRSGAGASTRSGCSAAARRRRSAPEVLRRVDDLRGDGGFVFAAVHNIQPNVPAENILAMWAALEGGERCVRCRGTARAREAVVPGRLVIEDGWIVDVVTDTGNAAWATGPLLAPGLIDVHVHGWGGHDGTGDAEALSGMARALLRQGITSFLPTAPSLPSRRLRASRPGCASGCPRRRPTGRSRWGSTSKGPFIAPARKGAHDPALLRTPENIDPTVVDASLDGLRIMTIAPELPGALALIERLAGWGSCRPSATPRQPGRGACRLSSAGTTTAKTTTHLFNAMTGVDHRLPGLAVAALTDDDAYVELVADRFHVHPSLWPIILRSKPAGRLVLVSDAMSLAGCGDGPGQIGGLDVVVKDGRVTLTRHRHPGRVGHRHQHGGPQPGPRGGSAPGRRRCGLVQPGGAPRGRRIAAGSRSAVGRTWWSWTTTCASVGSTRGAGWYDGATKA